jgi:hypothetical protein
MSSFVEIVYHSFAPVLVADILQIFSESYILKLDVRVCVGEQ